MKYLLLILSTSILLSGEMEVDGDLKVTGTIQASTIDSLLSLIAQLEIRIAQLECQNTGIIPDGYCDCLFHTLDECGVCDGDTTTCQDCAGVPNGDAEQDNCGICDNDPSNDCVQDCNGEWGGSAVEDVCGICGGDVESEDDCLVYDQDGNGYHTIQIGDLIWMKENIRTLANRACYNEDPENCEIYGGLYLYPDARNACPSGWHTATESEFINLYSYYGGQGSAGSTLMDDELWTGTNESQFSAVPAGYYHSNACGGLGFCSINTVNFIWFGDTPARNTVFYNDYNIVHENRGESGQSHFFSVRCIQD